jgi:hypothetical protein
MLFGKGGDNTLPPFINNFLSGKTAIAMRGLTGAFIPVNSIQGYLPLFSYFLRLLPNLLMGTPIILVILVDMIFNVIHMLLQVLSHLFYPFFNVQPPSSLPQSSYKTHV